MPDYSPILDRMANALEGPNPWIMLVVGMFGGGVFTFLAEWALWSRQTNKANEDKRQLVSMMLDHELSRRWVGKIGDDLRELLGKEFCIDLLREFCHDTILSEEDLPICKMAYSNALEL